MIKLIKKQDEINAFILIFNGSNVRLDYSQLQVLDLLNEMLPNFFNNVILVLNFMSQSEGEKKKRERAGRGDIVLRANVKEELSQRFRVEAALPTYLIDCLFDKDDQKESKAFETSLKNILASANIFPPYDPSFAKVVKQKLLKAHEELKEAKEVTEEKKKELKRKQKELKL